VQDDPGGGDGGRSNGDPSPKVSPPGGGTAAPSKFIENDISKGGRKKASKPIGYGIGRIVTKVTKLR